MWLFEVTMYVLEVFDEFDVVYVKHLAVTGFPNWFIWSVPKIGVAIWQKLVLFESKLSAIRSMGY
jgi:hypothetical protein